MHLLNISDLSVHYGHIAAVRNLSLSVDQSEIVAITGPNGAGKSSTLLAIAGAIPVTSGTIQIEQTNVLGLTPEVIARQGLSLVPEGRHIFSRLTVEENLLLGASAWKTKTGITSQIEHVFDEFPILRARSKAMAGSLSGGEQQQLAIGRALMARPKIMLLDEPSLGLAPKIIDHVYDIIENLRQSGVTFLIVEESMTRALDFADRVYVMSSGIIAMSGTRTELADRRELENAYFGLTDSSHGAD